MFRDLFAWFRVRKAVYKMTTSMGEAKVKVLFKGALVESESRLMALQKVEDCMEKGEVLISLKFEGIED